MNTLAFRFSPKIIMYFFMAFLILPSCGGTKKVPKGGTVENGRKKVYNPTTGRYEYETEVSGKIDTVQWSKANPKDNPPIVSDPSQYKKETTSSSSNEPTGSKHNSYNVAIMMPFQTDKTNTLEGGISESSMDAINFYEGVKMALDELSESGVSLNVSVMDTKRSESVTNFLLERNDVQNAHLIIGPYSTKPLKKVAEFAKKNKKPLISPTNTGTTITRDNPWYIQTNPSLPKHCQAIMKHALKNHPSDRIVLAVRNKNAEKKRLKYFQDANKEYQKDAKAPKLREFIIDAEIADQFQDIDFTPYIQESQKTVFIVPSYSNENFIISFLRQLELARGTLNAGEIVVYGMPRWMEYERISYDYFERLNVHFSNANYADKDKSEIKNFRKRFFAKYGSIPTDKAFTGYDLTKYFGKQLQSHGTGLANKIPSNPYQGLSTKYVFKKNVSPENIAKEDYSKINYWENVHVNILRFVDHHYEIAK